jgi:hypothetical protein
LYSEQLTNVTWAKPDPLPNALHTAFTHLKAVVTRFASASSRVSQSRRPIRLR